ncbi:MAG: hypothetical protein ACR2PF_15245 [Rhizobiaceae bacterium]
MIALVIQTVLLFAIAFILGCIVGCLLRSLFGFSAAGPEASTVGETKSAIAKAQTSAPSQSTPVAVDPPVPVTPVQPEEVALVETPPAAFAAPEPEKKEPPAKTVLAVDTDKPVADVAKGADDPPKQKIPAATTPDNLKLIRGIGTQNEARLNSLGVNSFVQIANWSKKEQAHFGDLLSFPGRIEREEWVSQAKVLGKGGTTDFSKRVRQGNVKSSAGDAKPVDPGTKPSGLLAAPHGEKGDNLTLIDGVGNALEKKLFRLGIYHFDQIAAMSADELKWLGNSVGFPGRPERENWAGESKVLAAGGSTGPVPRVERGQIRINRKSDE